MLKSCSYCGRIHRTGERCSRAPARRSGGCGNNDPKIRAFRDSSVWQNKRDAIKSRDQHLCAACRHGAPRTLRRYNSEALSVHHIVPLTEDWGLRLEDDNLITLCDIHHPMADGGQLSRATLRSYIPPGEDAPKS